MGLIRKVDCVQIPVPDLEAALAFYRDRLGHALVWRTPTAAGLRLPETDAELVLQTERPDLEPNLLVASVDQAVAAFTAAGGSVAVVPFPIAIGKCAVVADPWGNRLVLLDAANGSLATDQEGNVVGVRPPTDGVAEPTSRPVPPPVPGIVFRDSAEGVTPEQLHGFFAGWRRPVPPEEHLRILRGSAAVALALAAPDGPVVGFATALTDGVLCAHLSLLEVLPAFRRQGIGHALVRRIGDRFRDLYAFDAVCDPELLPFYEGCGLRPGSAALRRSYA